MKRSKFQDHDGIESNKFDEKTGKKRTRDDTSNTNYQN
jgi:hypothetical protein